MKRHYTAAFIIPKGVSRVLTENGWEFNTTARLPIEVKNFLIEALHLKFQESYLGIDVYESEDNKASVIYDDQYRIENVYFQLYGCDISSLESVFQPSSIANQSELFVPKP